MDFTAKSLLVFAFFASAFSAASQFTIDIPGATSTYVTGINNQDHIVGYYTDDMGVTSGFYFLGDQIVTLNISGQNTWLGGINNNDVMVGRYNPTGATNDYHVFIYNPVGAVLTEIPLLDGYDFTSANDINDNLEIAGDLKNGANRRFFIYSDADGLNTQNVLISGSPVPTYGGYSIDNSGRITGYYIDGTNYYSFRYHPDLGYLESVDLPDPEVPSAHKTRLMGANGSGKAVLDFILSDNCHIYDFNDPSAWSGLEKLIPGSTEIHMLDINDADHVVGWYTDANFDVHGFADLSLGCDFDLLEDGHAFNNESDPVWNWDFEAYSLWYNTDPYYGSWYNLPFPEIYPGYLFPSSSYPSWVDYVKVMSPQSCYFNIDFQGNLFDYPVMRPHAFSSWKVARTDGFEGACFGMASNAGASWQYPALLDQKFNAWGQSAPLEDIYNLGQNDILISAANQGMAAQASQTFTFLNSTPNDKLPHEILNQLLPIYLYDTEVPIVAFNLQLSSGLFGHAVFPYYVVPGNDLNTYHLYIYDPNATGDLDAAFDIVYDETLSTYSVQFGEETTAPKTYGMRLMHTQEIYDPVLMPGVVGPIQELNEEGEQLHADVGGDRDELVRLFNLGTSEFSIDGNGGLISVNGSELTNTINGAEPWLTYGGQPQTISQFKLPIGSYSMISTESDNGYYSAGLIDGETTIVYHRYGTNPLENDAVELAGSQLSYINQTVSNVEIRAEVMTYVDGNEYYFDITGLNLDTDQSVSLENQMDGLYISNDGSPTQYTVEVQVFDEENGFFTTVVSGIPLGEGITQIIIPNFGVNGLDGITITEIDDDPDTEDVTYDLDNTGLPNLILSTDTMLLSNFAQTVSFAVGNLGSGSMNWEVISSPTWLSITSSTTGINFGQVDLSLEANPDPSRSGTLVVQTNGDPALTATLYIQQSDVVNSMVEDTQLKALVAPNPTSRLLTVQLPSLMSGVQASYMVRDQQGRIVLQGICLGSQFTLDLQDCADGFYVLDIISDDLRHSEKVIKLSAGK